MFKGLEYVKETIDLRECDITNNAFETNNLLIDDILMALGYNKKREPGVKAIYSDFADWEVAVNGENRFVLAVYGFNSDKPSLDSIESTLAFAEQGEFRFVIITDGSRLSIVENRNIILECNSIFDDTNDEVLSYLSKTEWQPDKISSLYIDNVLTIDRIGNSLKNKKEDIINIVLADLNIESTDKSVSITSDCIDTILSKENKDEEQELENQKLRQALEELKNDTTNIEELKKLNEQLIIQSEELNSYKEKIILLENEKGELSKELENIQSIESTNEKTDETEETDRSIEIEYREKISQLTEDKQKLTLELNTLKDKVEEMELKQAGAEDEKVIMARQLLDAVEDNEELNRTYVGVVNSKLFQIGELTKFIGTCIQELYSTVSFDLMHLLFDGDIFKIVQPAIREDLLINAKTYDIDTEYLTEDEVLARLKTLFSKFEKVIFMCKTIGTVKLIESADDYQSEQMEFDNISDETTDEGDDFTEPDLIDSREENELTEPENSDTDLVLGLALCDIGPVVWSDTNPINAPIAISNEEHTFRINNESYDTIINSSIISFLNLNESTLNTLTLLKSTDLTTVSANIHENRIEETDIRILDTNYYVEVDSMQKCISLLLAFGDILEVNNTEVYMYFEAEYNSGNELSNNYVNKESLGLDIVFNTEEVEEYNDSIHCILSGTYIDEIVNMPNMEKFGQKIVNNTMAVRTSYMTNSLRTTSDVAKSVATSLDRVEIDEVPDIIEQINKKINYGTDVIALSSEGLSEDAIEFVAGTSLYYIDKLPGYITTLLIFYAHKFSEKNSIIDIRVELNSPLYIAYQNGIVTTDCIEYNNIRLFIEITKGKTKIISK